MNNYLDRNMSMDKTSVLDQFFSGYINLIVTYLGLIGRWDLAVIRRLYAMPMSGFMPGTWFAPRTPLIYNSQSHLE